MIFIATITGVTIAIFPLINEFYALDGFKSVKSNLLSVIFTVNIIMK